MAWLRITLTDAEQAVVDAERDAHPEAHVRRMLVLRLLHCGVTRAKGAEVAGLGRATVQRYAAAYREGGLDGLIPNLVDQFRPPIVEEGDYDPIPHRRPFAGGRDRPPV